MAECVEHRRFRLKGPGNLVLSQTGQSGGVGHDLLIAHQTAACGVNHTLDHYSGLAEQTVEYGNYRHILLPCP